MINFDVDTTKKEQAGVWATFEDSQLLIAHMSNAGFQREFARLQRPYMRDIKKDRLDPNVAKDIMCKAMAAHVLLNWKDVIDNSEQQIIYSPASAYSLLSRNSAVRQFVIDYSTDLDNFNNEALEELGK